MSAAEVRTACASLFAMFILKYTHPRLSVVCSTICPFREGIGAGTGRIIYAVKPRDLI
jgi:hypothetical protein